MTTADTRPPISGWLYRSRQPGGREWYLTLPSHRDRAEALASLAVGDLVTASVRPRRGSRKVVDARITHLAYAYGRSEGPTRADADILAPAEGEALRLAQEREIWADECPPGQS